MLFQYLSSYLSEMSVVKAAFCFRVMYLLMDFLKFFENFVEIKKKILNIVFYTICSCTFIDCFGQKTTYDAAIEPFVQWLLYALITER